MALLQNNGSTDGCKRLYGPQCLKYLLSGPLQKKSANLWGKE